MSKKKSSINQNFEALKAQMQAKRKLAESKFEKEQEEKDEITSEEPVNTQEEIITLNIVDDEEYDSSLNAENTNTEELEETEVIDEPTNTKVEEKPEITITPTPKKQDYHENININKIIIKKVEKQEAPKRITYYLKPETIKKIDKFSKATGMGKSEFVQTILDEILNNLEVEK